MGNGFLSRVIGYIVAFLVFSIFLGLGILGFALKFYLQGLLGIIAAFAFLIYWIIYVKPAFPNANGQEILAERKAFPSEDEQTSNFDYHEYFGDIFVFKHPSLWRIYSSI
jgi:hypothetical protein